jgi:regulator of protease activity HflC (stomatin/prohibitin superfamily)
MALDKWQTRQAAQHARDNGVSVAEAEAELFPEESGVANVASAEGEGESTVAEAEGEGESTVAEAEGDKEPPEGAKVSTRKR